MAVVASTILGLIQNLRAFGGILVVSPGVLVAAWVGWLCEVCGFWWRPGWTGSVKSVGSGSGLGGLAL